MTRAQALKPSERAIARRIDPTSLQLFLAACEPGSIGKAAERELVARDFSAVRSPAGCC
jgi:hypothetical protein